MSEPLGYLLAQTFHLAFVALKWAGVAYWESSTSCSLMGFSCGVTELVVLILDLDLALT